MTDGELCILFREKQDEHALAELISRYKDFCYAEARKRHYTRIEVEDLVAEGEIGITKAALKYDPDKGVKFLSYAGKGIKNNMNDLIERFIIKDEPEPWENDWVISVYCKSDLLQRTLPVEEKVVRKLYSAEVMRCIRHLSEREKRILLEKFFDPPALWALTHPGVEIPDEKLAEHFGMPLRLLKRNLREAYDKLQEELDPTLADQKEWNRGLETQREKGTFIDDYFWIIS